MPQFDAARLELITIKAEHAVQKTPTSAVAQDLLWLTTELRKAWIALEKRNG